jgi:glycosyltransferase involved in cell wall biosynthesis
MVLRPKVSVVIPCYHSEKYLRQCIDSLIAQTYENWEAVFVDDKPSKEMIDIMEEYSNRDSRIRYSVWWRKTSPACARNRGIDHSVGEYVAFLDADDWWYPDKLSKQVNYMENHPHTDWCYGMATVQEGVRQYPFRITSYTHPCPDEMIPFQTVFVRKQLIETIINKDQSVFDESLAQIDDYDLFLRLKQYPNYCFAQPLSYYRRHNGGLTSSTNQQEVTRLQLLINLRKHHIHNIPYMLAMYVKIVAADAVRPYRKKIGKWLDNRCIFLQIEPTTRCNLNCVKCSHKNDTPIADIDLKTILKIVVKHPNVHTILLQGLGEPFLHPDFYNLCTYTKRYCKFLQVVTNGTVGIEAATSLLKEGTLDHITVSVDTLDPELAKKTRGSNYNIEKVKNFVIALAAIDPQKVAVNYVRGVYNFYDQQALHEFCDNLWIPLHVTPIHNFYEPGRPEWQGAHDQVLAERGISGERERPFHTNCPFLHGKRFYYDAVGRRHPCCIRMRYDQIFTPTEETCKYCPE